MCDEREIGNLLSGDHPAPTLRINASKPHFKKHIKKQLTQEGQCGKIIPVADEATPFERAMKKISKKSFDKPLRMW